MAEQPNITPVPPADSSSQPSSKPGKPSKPSVKTAVPTASSLLTPRYIPGAPPPKPAAEKKKRQKKTKTPASNDGGSIAAEGDQSDAGVNVSDTRSAALTDQAPAKEDILSGRVADELVATEKEIQEKVVEEISDDEPEAELEEWNIFKKAGSVDVLKREIKKLEGRLVSRTLGVFWSWSQPFTLLRSVLSLRRANPSPNPSRMRDLYPRPQHSSKRRSRSSRSFYLRQRSVAQDDSFKD